LTSCTLPKATATITNMIPYVINKIHISESKGIDSELY
jgi:hypothetical protein